MKKVNQLPLPDPDAYSESNDHRRDEINDASHRHGHTCCTLRDNENTKCEGKAPLVNLDGYTRETEVQIPKKTNGRSYLESCGVDFTGMIGNSWYLQQPWDTNEYCSF